MNKTRRNKTEGGKRKKSQGGKRKTRKMSSGATAWRESVMKVYRDMKKKDSNVKLGTAMKKAAELKRKGLL